MKPYRVRCMDCHTTTGRCEVPHSTGICARCFHRRYGGEKPGMDPWNLVLLAAIFIVGAWIAVGWILPDATVAAWMAAL